MRMKDISKLDCFWTSSFRDLSSILQNSSFRGLSSILQNSSLWNSSSVWKIHFFFFFNV